MQKKQSVHTNAIHRCFFIAIEFQRIGDVCVYCSVIVKHRTFLIITCVIEQYLCKSTRQSTNKAWSVVQHRLSWLSLEYAVLESPPRTLEYSIYTYTALYDHNSLS